ncbi:outer membrane lipid asymmetry maintenance protein MlaD [Thalassobaculum sp. OXR-137]|uniref:outer membrane lipid asymmetry maintenance protein MlaD n=1 Tax=Thalassobaculum sp. OXR-137 TaxID=3100173 RepID=UPI002AC93938|nr:outer membrane lipid asymmetry maintenance protein MlaD [Thalassobaculum sp. OXR-137]WPZ34255.1 outer membrane lipid asymmetry maintenance protein MlaD [Thalassobaculum sp. OXR-137]
MSRGVIETLMGAVVLAVAGLFLFYAYASSEFSTGGGYEVIARFTTVGGLKPGSDVRMSGIKVGTVSKQVLDPNTYLAEVTLSIDESIKLPIDSSAAVSSEGLLGGNFVDLVPGADEKMLQPGERIELTQDAVDFVQMLSRFMFQAGSSGSSSGSGASGSTAPAPGLN